MTRASMTQQEVLEEAQRLRALLDDRTCCADHALSVAMVCAAMFALEGRERNEAIDRFEGAAQELAEDLRDGALDKVRLQS